jgi:hypothetical protein
MTRKRKRDSEGHTKQGKARDNDGKRDREGREGEKDERKGHEDELMK